ncbi:MAG: glycosyltransferase family 2 protein [Bacteroidota bacterium]
MRSNQSKATTRRLPSPLQKDRTGFPWQISELPIFDDTRLPQLSIVVPSYQQGRFLEETLRSILLQYHPKLELIVIDGGSTDETVSILEYYSPWIDYWVSEKDNGQSHAINKGLKVATGDWLAFMNSDDGYLEGTFAHLFAQPLSVDFIYGNQGFVGKVRDDAQLRKTSNIHPLKLSGLLRFFRDVNYIIPSQSVFFSRALLERVGYFDEALHFGMDLDWYARATLLNPTCIFNEFPTYFYRLDEHAKTANYHWKGFYEVVGITKKYMTHLPYKEQERLLEEIAYDEVLRKVVAAKQIPDWRTFQEWLLSSPRVALRDRRFWGMLKKKLLAMSR